MIMMGRMSFNRNLLTRPVKSPRRQNGAKRAGIAIVAAEHRSLARGGHSTAGSGTRTNDRLLVNGMAKTLTMEARQ
jgi:hypothetical protein